VDGVPYPMNRDKKWQRVPVRKREEQIRKNEKALLKLLARLSGKEETYR